MTQLSALHVKPIELSSFSKSLGVMAAIATVLIWSGYFLSLRSGVQSGLSLIDLSLIRFSLPGLLLLPVFLRSIPSYRNTHVLYLVGILLGSGIGFFMLSAVAMRSTSVLIGSTLIPGTAPVFVSLVALVVFKQHITPIKKLGLSLILIGVVAFLASALTTASAELLFGQLLLILCAFIWALFTISVRQSGLKPLQVSALVVVPNGLVALVWLLATQPTLGFDSISLTELSFQIIVQGILVGIFSGLFYATAITKLGAEKTSAIGAATPVVATLLAIVFLKEALEFIPLLGLSLTAVGVVLASRQS